MALFSTPYPNPSRIVSGTPQLYADDVVLLCNTTSSAVTINLDQIPANYWNTTWKLYVVDNSDNAGTNNITINAPSGYTINNQASVVINEDGGEFIVRISSNTSFLATYNSSTCLCVDYISVTYSSLSSLISTDAVQIGQNYLISDAIFLVNTTDIYASENVPVMVKGIATNGVSLEGSGIFLNADYQQDGDYSGVSGFVANIGVWTASLTPVANDVCMWNNFHYKNLTGANGVTDPSVDTTNWVLLSKSVTNGYIQEIDFILYNQDTNRIIFREDKRLNQVDKNDIYGDLIYETFALFQWGNDNVQNNIVKNESMFINCNNLVIGTPTNISQVAIFGNTLFSSTINLQSNSGIFSDNTLNNSTINIVNNLGTFSSNNLINGSNFAVVEIDSACTISFNFLMLSEVVVNDVSQRLFQFNQLNNSTFVFDIMAGSIINLITNNAYWTIPQSDSVSGSCIDGNSTIEWFLDFGDPTIWNSGTNTLTIPIGLTNIIGVYKLQNTGGASINKIVNLSDQFPTTFKSNNQSFTIRSVAVSGAVTNEIISDLGVHNYVLSYRINGNDYITLVKNGTLNGVQSNIIYA